MQIVIDIPKDVYKETLRTEVWNDYEKRAIRFAIRNCTPLPKRHGNLFDENDFEKRVAIMTESMDLGYGEIMDIIDEIPTIIEADKRK